MCILTIFPHKKGECWNWACTERFDRFKTNWKVLGATFKKGAERVLKNCPTIPPSGKSWGGWHPLRKYGTPILDPHLKRTGSYKFGVVIVSWLVSEWVSEWVSLWTDFLQNGSNKFDNFFMKIGNHYRKTIAAPFFSKNYICCKTAPLLDFPCFVVVFHKAHWFWNPV